jgi:hypothetical protein
MADSSSIPVQSLSQRLQVLAAAEPSPFPVVSLYLNLATGQNGRENYEAFVRKAFSDRAKGLTAESPERESCFAINCPGSSPTSAAWAHYCAFAF